MRLYWSARSPFVRKVSIVAAETGTEARIERVAMAIAQPKVNADVLAANPVGKIPVLLLDDGLALTDSRVICEYLDTLHDGPRLFPEGTERWAALRWQAMGDGLLEQLLLWRNESLRPDGERSQAFMDGYRTRFMEGFDRLEAEAGALAASPFSIGHIAIGCMLGFADFRFADLGWREGRPALADWYSGFAARPSALANPADPDAAQ
ncbi:glutathione S-transferase [Sphingomonas sp. G-3-2-10]|uniref:glutathione S-transferase family protein n=1 Tax=Sphingomonas sp. G-3-2-10 TaxID=2728838 RepID=UPI00146C7891|nr:glutathione S-transferase [Sphingomonas sp. G-3-2-10]NML08174.1 glutathione S-transferase [Sphingomonas sp. G-3-2-10]